jgi:TRAP-type C4-dicarboxylate transport system permease small subunit
MTSILKWLATLWAYAGGICLLAIVLVTTANVGAFGLDRIAALWGADVSGLSGYEDFVRLTISVAALMFFPYCQSKRGHVKVDLFTDRAPRKVNRALDALWLLVTVVTAMFLAYWMWFGMLESRADGQLSRVLGWPEWPFYAPGIFSLLLWALVAVAQLFERDLPTAETSRG